MNKSTGFVATLTAFCTILFIASAVGFASAQDVNGIWKAENSTFIFYQEGQTVKVMCSYRWETASRLSGSVKES